MHDAVLANQRKTMSKRMEKIQFRSLSLKLGLLMTCLVAVQAHAGGGLVLEGDTCILTVEFYSAHFTAYQPQTRGNEQFCRELPELGETLFVLDYLHQSLKEVPVSFRIIRNTTGQGRFTKLKHVEAIEDLDTVTVFEQPPVVRPNGSFQVSHDFTETGEFVGIVTAGHPSKDTIYTAIFPFAVGVGSNSYGLWALLAIVLATGSWFVIRRQQRPAIEQAATAS